MSNTGDDVPSADFVAVFEYGTKTLRNPLHDSFLYTLCRPLCSTVHSSERFRKRCCSYGVDCYRRIVVRHWGIDSGQEPVGKFPPQVDSKTISKEKTTNGFRRIVHTAEARYQRSCDFGIEQ